MDGLATLQASFYSRLPGIIDDPFIIFDFLSRFNDPGISGLKNPPPRKTSPCEGGKGYWNGVASRLETFADVTGAGAFTAAGVGLALAPTGGGFALAETAALGLGFASTVASFGAAGASYLGGNNSRAAVNLVGAIGGFGIGKAVERGVSSVLARSRTFGNLSTSQTRQAAYVGSVSGAFGGKAAGTAAEGVCVANTAN